MSGRASGRLSCRFARAHRGGGALVGCAAAAPLILLALAVGADYASVARFKARVQLAAEAASLAAAEAAARDSRAGGDSDALAARAAAAAFISRAPRGAAGAPTVAAQSRAGLATASVAYAGQAPSNFGAALGYEAISAAASAVSPARLAESGLSAAH